MSKLYKSDRPDLREILGTETLLKRNMEGSYVLRNHLGNLKGTGERTLEGIRNELKETRKEPSGSFPHSGFFKFITTTSFISFPSIQFSSKTQFSHKIQSLDFSLIPSQFLPSSCRVPTHYQDLVFFTNSLYKTIKFFVRFLTVISQSQVRFQFFRTFSSISSNAGNVDKKKLSFDLNSQSPIPKGSRIAKPVGNVRLSF